MAQLEGVLPECVACAKNPVEHVGLNRERLSQTLEHLRPRANNVGEPAGPAPLPDQAPDPKAFATHLSGVGILESSSFSECLLTLLCRDLIQLVHSHVLLQSSTRGAYYIGQDS